MSTFQPNRRRTQPPKTQPTARPTTTEPQADANPTPSNNPLTPLRSVRDPTLSYTSVTPRLSRSNTTLRSVPGGAQLTRPGNPPILRSAPVNPILKDRSRQKTPLLSIPETYPPVPRRPHSEEAIFQFDKLVNHLLERRPQHAKSFINQCWQLYKTEFSSSSRRKPSRPDEPGTPRGPAIVDVDVPQPPPPTDPDVLVVSEKHANAPPVRSSTRDQTGSPAQTRASGTISDPSSVELVIPSTEVMPPIKKVDLDISLFSRQARLEYQVYERCRAFLAAEKNVDDTTANEEKSHTIWQPSSSTESPISLKADGCCMALLDSTAKISQVHLKALRFLWFHLIESTCTGAVLNHGIGYPRTHIIYLLAQLIVSSPGRKEDRILVVCPLSSASEWKMSAEQFETLNIYFLRDKSWHEQISDWRATGGVMVATEAAYFSILTDHVSAERNAALAALCSPGPDICVLDEASRMNIPPSQPLFRRMLNRTRTKSRLAMTSLPLAGFLERSWSIVDWACPFLFGTRVEFQSNFVNPIADGQKTASSLEEARKAFKKACFLYNRMSMITFSLDAKMRKEALRAKGLRLLESVIWINLQTEEHEVYRTTEVFLHGMIKNEKFSPFLAMELLIRAGSSIWALVKTLRIWSEATDAFLRSNGQLETFRSHRASLGELLEMVEAKVPDGMVPTKMQLTWYIGRQCLLNEERLVIFASSQDLLTEAGVFLRSKFDDKVHVYDPGSEIDLRAAALNCFNTAQEGALLVAPYGPTFHCMEESGWGFVNATRIVFLDSTWFSEACVQAANRVHNFAQQNNHIHVHHMLANNTIEQALANVLDGRYEKMKNCDSSEMPAAMSNAATDRSFLIGPEVSPRWIREKPPNMPANTQIPKIQYGDQDESIDDSIVKIHEDIVMPLKDTVVHGDQYCVNALSFRTDRYDTLSQSSDVWMRSEWSRKARFVSEEKNEEAMEKDVRGYRNSLHKLGGGVLVALRNAGDSGGWLSQDDHFIENAADVCHLLSCWDPYARYYERKIPLTDLPPLPEKRGEKRQRSPSQDRNITESPDGDWHGDRHRR